VNYSLLGVAIRRWEHSGHKGMQQYSGKQWQCSFGTKDPKVCQENIRHIITPAAA